MAQYVVFFYEIFIIIICNFIRYMQQLACRFHPEAELIPDSRAGDMICPLCGLVVAER
jgi:hypothetical protein